MISVDAATEMILQAALPELPMVHVPLPEAAGRILREPIVADRDFPPFDRVTMDGIAIRYADFAAGERTFRISGVGAAGVPQVTLPAAVGSCVEIMTGAMLPLHADTVVRYEDLHLQDGKATFNEGVQVREGQNVHRRGEDRQRGQAVLLPGMRLSAAEIGVAATVGRASLRVAQPPRAAIISTGDELVDVTVVPLPHQIRRSNSYQLAALLSAWGCPADTFHLPDDPAVIRRELREWLRRYPLLVLSGGVSMGKFDYLPRALADLEVEQQFHQVAQRPGKPLWFGVHPGGARVFALPGNPVSGFVCALRYVQPWLRASLGLRPFEPAYATLAEPFTFPPPLTYFLPVRTEMQNNGCLLAWSLPGHGSGDLANLTAVDAFLELPAERSDFQAGEAFPLLRLR